MGLNDRRLTKTKQTLLTYQVLSDSKKLFFFFSSQVLRQGLKGYSYFLILVEFQKKKKIINSSDFVVSW